MAIRIPIPPPRAGQADLPLGLPAPRAPMVTVDQAHRYAFTRHIREAAQIAQDEYDSTRQDDDRYEQEQARAWVSKAASDDQLKWNERALARQRTAEPGAPNHTPGLLKEYDDYSAYALQAAPPRARAAYQERLTRLRTHLGMQAVSFEATQNRAHTVSQYRDAFAADARTIALNPDAYDEARIFGSAALAASTLPADIRAGLMREAHAQWANAAASTRSQANPREVLAAMAAAAANKPLPPGYGWIAQLEAAAIERTRSQAQAEVDRRENQARIAAGQRQAAAAGALNAYTQQLSLGVPPRAEDMNRWTALIRGSDHEAEFNRLQQGYGQVQSLFARPVAEQLEGLQAMQSRLQTEGGSAQDVAMVARAQAALAANIQMQTQEPLRWLEQFADVPIEPLDTALLATEDGAAQYAATLAARESAIAALQQQNPGTAIAPVLLQPQEAQQLVQAFGAARAREAGQLLGALMAAIGPENTARQDAFFAQLEAASAGQAQDMVRVAALAATGAHSRLTNNWFGKNPVQSGPDAAATVLDGRDIVRANGQIKDGPRFTLPKEADLMARIQETLGEVYGSAVAGDSAYTALLADAQIIKYWYVAEAARAGKLKQDVDNGVLEQAIRATVGEVAKVNGSHILLPRGMEEARFARHANLAIEESLKGAGLWAEGTDTSDYGLVTLGGARYMVTLGDEPTGLTVHIDPADSARDAAIVRSRDTPPAAGAPAGLRRSQAITGREAARARYRQSLDENRFAAP